MRLDKIKQSAAVHHLGKTFITETSGRILASRSGYRVPFLLPAHQYIASIIALEDSLMGLEALRHDPCGVAWRLRCKETRGTGYLGTHTPYDLQSDVPVRHLKPCRE